MRCHPRVNHWIPRPITGKAPKWPSALPLLEHWVSPVLFVSQACLLKQIGYNCTFFIIIQVNLDFHTKEIIAKSITKPTLHSFDAAQSRVYQLMEQDSYTRFLKSDIYLDLTEGRPQRPTNLRRRSRSFTYNEFQDVKSDVAIWL